MTRCRDDDCRRQRVVGAGSNNIIYLPNYYHNYRYFLRLPELSDDDKKELVAESSASHGKPIIYG